MRLLEYECKKLVARYNIQVPRGVLLFSKQQHFDIKTPVMLKAQIPLGGRGKAGGVVEAGGPRDARKKLDGLFSNQLRGYGVTRVLAEQKVDVKEEYFMAITYDTVQKRPVAVFSTQG
ncbi:MAG: ATP-grasp domain-containing protein, partial [Spirochaetota bacterium]